MFGSERERVHSSTSPRAHDEAALLNLPAGLKNVDSMQDTDSKRLSMEEDKREYVPYKSKYSLTIKNDKLKSKKHGTKQQLSIA